MPAPLKHNWPSLWKEFKDRPDKALTQADWCILKGLSQTDTSKHFSVYRKEERERAIEEARQALATAAPVSVGVLRASLHSDDENLRQKAATAILDRAGLSPQAVTVQVQQVNAQQAVVVPLIAGKDADDLAKLIGGEE